MDGASGGLVACPVSGELVAVLPECFVEAKDAACAVLVCGHHDQAVDIGGVSCLPLQFGESQLQHFPRGGDDRNICGREELVANGHGGPVSQPRSEHIEGLGEYLSGNNERSS